MNRADTKSWALVALMSLAACKSFLQPLQRSERIDLALATFGLGRTAVAYARDEIDAVDAVAINGMLDVAQAYVDKLKSQIEAVRAQRGSAAEPTPEEWAAMNRTRILVLEDVEGALKVLTERETAKRAGV